VTSSGRPASRITIGVTTNQRRIGFRTFGKSTDSRDDLPQIVIGMAVTRTGIPVRVWCRPGNTGDQALIRQVKDDMRDWTLARIVWVADRGFSSEQNRRYLRKSDHHYIIGEKLRSDSPEIKAALSRQGRYTPIAGNMRVKEVKVSEHERFVICHNPDGAARDAAIRSELLTKLEELIEGSDKLSPHDRGVLHGKISVKPGLNRFLRVTPAGKLRIDAAKIKTEANLDGKYLLRCSDPHLSPEEIATGYNRHGHQYLAGCGQAVPESDQRPAPSPVGDPARDHFGDRRGALGQTFYQAHDGYRSTQHRGQEDRQDRVEHFRGGVLQEGHRGDHPQIRGQPSDRTIFLLCRDHITHLGHKGQAMTPADPAKRRSSRDRRP
jgi:Transposase DDE domain